MCSPSGVPLGFRPPTPTLPPQANNKSHHRHGLREKEGEKRAEEDEEEEEKATGEREREGEREGKGPIGGQRRQELLLAQGFGLIARPGGALAAARQEEVTGSFGLGVVMLLGAGEELCMCGGGVVAHRCSVDRASVRRSVQEVEGERNY